ncbi:enolase C-terminal domain-like protein [Bryobacter aggregatus]|uniref:enolase C-terminal domain-like protein n=1 Tax=Bryobacter aggregatus TaxID=360054 RepID=UPI00068E4F8D|nr:enolase C-terminal domain-like protein [Bryobacter aggregatus]
MRRRDLFKTVLAAPVLSAAAQDQVAKRTNGLPPLTIKDVKIITTSGGRNYRWVFLKIITSEPGLYGIGSANDIYQTAALISALEKNLKPWLIGKDPSKIEDLWHSANYKTYWRGGPVNNKVLGAMDEALWDIKGKRAGMPVYELLGGKAHDAVACYDHVSGRSHENAAEVVAKSFESGYRHIRLQYGEGGYGGGGFYPAGKGERAEQGYQGPAFDEDLYVQTIPKVFEYVRSKVGFEPKLLHDVHSHLGGPNAMLFSKKIEDSMLYFVEDILGPENLGWYKEIRKVSATPQAVGEVFSNTAEYYPLIAERLINFIRCRVTAIGGITPAKKLAHLCEVFGVKTAFQEGGENDPVNQLAAYHVDLSSTAFGIQEENHFPPSVHEMMPGTAQIRRGYMYGSGKPGLGIDIDEALAAKYPITEPKNGGAYPTDRSLGGTVVTP